MDLLSAITRNPFKYKYVRINLGQSRTQKAPGGEGGEPAGSTHTLVVSDLRSLTDHLLDLGMENFFLSTQGLQLHKMSVLERLPVSPPPPFSEEWLLSILPH